MVLSVSGFRKIFAESGDMQDGTDRISEEDKLICVAMAKAFADVVKPLKVLLARDARPTGNAICTIIGQVLEAEGISVGYAGICCAPEIMAQSSITSCDAFVYVSASHNPIGYNGVKFGKNGGVFDRRTIQPVIDRLKKLVKDEQLLENIETNALKSIIKEDENLKKQCLDNYARFADITNFSVKKKFNGTGVVADMNGSARCLSIDRQYLEGLGIKIRLINNTAGEIAHEIVPEGKNLDQCRDFLEKMHAEDPDFVFGYVPDNDGDRGNLVYIDNSGKAQIMQAQDVFALCVYSTLLERKNGNTAVVFNGPTSMRSDRICEKMGVKVFRAEVGEANVVEKAELLRKNGYNVPILGEGSNGGNITYPAKVRDPLNTVIAVCRLLDGGKTINQVLDEIPRYITTSSFDEEGTVHINTANWLELKKSYIELFRRYYQENSSYFVKNNLVSYKITNTEGTEEREGEVRTGKSGLKIIFIDSNGEIAAYLWMRPSGTEPLLRISADVRGTDAHLYSFLINLQRSLILEARKILNGSNNG